MNQANRPKDLGRILEYLKEIDGLCFTADLEQSLLLDEKYAQNLYRELAAKRHISGSQNEEIGYSAVMIESKGYDHEYQEYLD